MAWHLLRGCLAGCPNARHRLRCAADCPCRQTCPRRCLGPLPAQRHRYLRPDLAQGPTCPQRHRSRRRHSTALRTERAHPMPQPRQTLHPVRDPFHRCAGSAACRPRTRRWSHGWILESAGPQAVAAHLRDPAAASPDLSHRPVHVLVYVSDNGDGSSQEARCCDQATSGDVGFDSNAAAHAHCTVLQSNTGGWKSFQGMPRACLCIVDSVPDT